jgi:hypothetical protein
MGPSGCQIDWQQGKTLQDSFDKGGALRPDVGLYRAIDPVEEFARRHDREKELFLLAMGKMLGQIKTTAFVLDQDTGIDQDCHGSRTSSRASASCAAVRSSASCAASVAER